MITIVANFKVKPESADEFRKAALACLKETRKEKGNITYRIYQHRDDKSAYTFFEEWLNDTVIEFHNKAAHFEKFINTITPMCESEPQITQLTAVPSVYF